MDNRDHDLDTSPEKKRRRIWRGALVAGALAVLSCVAIVQQHPLTSRSIDLLAPSLHWQMAGAQLAEDGHGSRDMRVTATELAIVNQDGTPGYENPPVNLYGAYLRHEGGFSLTYDLGERTDTASLSIMSKPPFVSDEEYASMGDVTLSVSDEQLKVTLSDQQDGTDHISETYPVHTTDSDSVKITDTNGKLSVSFNDRAIDSFDDNDVFAGDQLWLGANADKAFTVTSLLARGEGGGSIEAADSRTFTTASDNGGLARLAVRHRADFELGAAVALGPMVSDGRYRDIYFQNFNALSTENAAKWQFIHPKPDVYNFTEMDAIVDIASRNNQQIHGHALIFGEANPGWVRDLAGQPEALKKAAIDHITTIMTRYKGRVKSWDVINEPLADYGTQPGTNGLRRNIWYDTLGADYIKIMFEAAHAADPDAELWLNDFGMENDQQRFEQALSLVKDLPYVNIGLQGHIDKTDTISSDTRMNVAILRARMHTLEQQGRKGRFSEVDISTASEHAVPSDFVRACLAETACRGVTFWGVTDKYSSSATVDNGIVERGTGLLWDESYHPTQGVSDIRNVLE